MALKPVFDGWKEVLSRNIKSAHADGRATRYDEIWPWTEAERADLDACKAEAREQIASTEAPLRPYLILVYMMLFELARARLAEYDTEGWVVLQIDDAKVRKRRRFRRELDHQPIPYLALVDGAGQVEAGLPWLDAEGLSPMLAAP